MQDFRNLQVWTKAHEMTLYAYRSTKSFPKEEMFGLTSQIRRACASIGANIAEGCGRKGNPELGRFLQIAMGSASEVESHILLARDLGMLSASEYKQFNSRVTELKRMLSTLINSLKEEDARRNARDEQLTY